CRTLAAGRLEVIEHSQSILTRVKFAKSNPKACWFDVQFPPPYGPAKDSIHFVKDGTMKHNHISFAAKSFARTAFPATNNPSTFRAVAVYALLIMVATCLAVPALAQSITGSFDGVGTLTPTGTSGIFIQNFVGDGTDTLFGAFTATSQSTVDFTNPPFIAITN